jgi:NarL family two-component system response regulator LiaR
VGHRLHYPGLTRKKWGIQMDNCKTIRVMIVDDHAMVRDGLKVFLSVFEDIEVVAEANNGYQAIELCQRFQPDVILMDILMPELDGPTATERIRNSYPRVQVIVLTSFVEQELVQKALQSGAISFLLKDVHAGKLAESIREACRGRGTIDSTAVKILMDVPVQPDKPIFDLSQRELEILEYIVRGATNNQIALALTISPGTVRFHVSNILSKMGGSNRTEAASLALQYGLVKK